MKLIGETQAGGGDAKAKRTSKLAVTLGDRAERERVELFKPEDGRNQAHSVAKLLLITNICQTVSLRGGSTLDGEEAGHEGHEAKTGLKRQSVCLDDRA
ncbi:hypothetical protein SRHO_G00238680 [Serrasalmus rhombeus]